MSANGISVMSMNLLLPNDEEPVVWRGPIISGVIKQFWEEVVWGELDYLVTSPSYSSILPASPSCVSCGSSGNLPMRGTL